MKLEGFIGAAYQLDSVNVDNQRCVNLYPEVIESGHGKEGQVAYLRGTPGLEAFEEVGDGPIRCIHVDSIGRVFVVSGAKIYSVSTKSQWRLRFDLPTLPAKAFLSTDWNAATDQVTITAHGFLTGLRVHVGLSGGGWDPNTDYYIIKVDANTVKIATSLANARAGTAINLASIFVDSTITPQPYGPLYNLEWDSINFASNTFSKDAHGLIDGLEVKFKATAQYPAGILPDTSYYVTNSSENTFRLASSLANALAGTAISFTEPAGERYVKQLGSEGEYGGSTVVLASSTGTVRAASMSAGGNGTDSSTIFVDGSNNYLLEDLEGDQALGVLGSVTYAQALVDITNDITITTLGNVDEHVLSEGITISDEVTSDPIKVGLNGENTVGISLYKDVVTATGETSYNLKIARGAQAYAQAVIDITNDITITRYELDYEDGVNEVDSHVASTGITIRNLSYDSGGLLIYVIDFYKDTLDKSDSHYYRIDVYLPAGGSLNTAELVAVLSTAESSFVTSGGKSFSFASMSSPPTGRIRTQLSRANYTFSGGGSQTTASAFGTPVSASFTAQQGPATTLTTAELVSALTNGYLEGITLRVDSWGAPYGPPAGTTRTALNVSNYTFEGGGSQQTSSAFGTPVQADFTREVAEGQGFGSVPSASHIVWSDGYFIVNQGGTNKFFISGLQDFEINTLDFTSSEGSPDIVLALAVINRYLYVFNEKTTEVYANTGNADFPFERIQGGFLETGCAAAGSVAKVGGNICFLARSEEGEGSVFSVEGLTLKRISTHAIEQAIRGYADISTATAYSYLSGGHLFYVLNFDEATWVYDLSTGMWHERAYTNAGDLERHRAQYCAYVPSLKVHLVGDYATNEVFVLSESKYSDNGNAITRLRTSPYVSAEGDRVRFNRFQLDMETGIGLDGAVQGSEPSVMLDWSNDNGHTWSSESWALADAGSGNIGAYQTRVVWRRLGQARDRVFRVKITDPVKVRLISALIDVERQSS